jgi:hypothetical protein
MIAGSTSSVPARLRRPSSLRFPSADPPGVSLYRSTLGDEASSGLPGCRRPCILKRDVVEPGLPELASHLPGGSVSILNLRKRLACQSSKPFRTSGRCRLVGVAFPDNDAYPDLPGRGLLAGVDQPPSRPADLLISGSIGDGPAESRRGPARDQQAAESDLRIDPAGPRPVDEFRHVHAPVRALAIVDPTLRLPEPPGEVPLCQAGLFAQGAQKRREESITRRVLRLGRHRDRR